jgi:type I restriction enzyme S subunit
MVETETKVQRYERYKESGVEWLGKIPEHWEALANKFIFNLKKNQVGKKSADYDLLSLTLKGIVIRNLDNGGKFPAEFDTYQEVKKGDFVFCLFDVEETPRCVGLSDYNGMITGAYTVMEPNENFDRSFLYYFYLNLDADKRMKPLYTGLRNTISKDNFFAFKTFVPPLSEQTAIAQFLDDKTTKIDEAITIKQQQINLLKERKQILIHKAVTRGLDDSVQLKDSGVEWIGDIPEGWEVKRLKFTSNLVSEKVLSKESQLEYIGMENIKSWTGQFIPSDSETDGLANYFDKGDVLFGKLRPYLAKVYLAKKEGICSSEFLVYRAGNLIYNWYLNLIMLSFEFINLIDSSTYGSKMPRANSEFIGNQVIPIPPLSEQKEISAYIETASQKIETAIGLKQQEIAKLKEYKSSLINGVVTGKVKVC